MQIQTNPAPAEVYRAFQAIGAIAEGKLLASLSIGTTTTKVRHGLGRVPKGWFEVSPRSGAAAIEQSQAPDDTFLYLLVATAIDAGAVWVF